jgi:hypothetical protein
MKLVNMWPKKPIYWIDNRVLMVSIPFTWNLPTVSAILRQVSFNWDSVIVGGPAVELIPGFFSSIDYVTEGHNMEGVLQRVNPLATRTTLGCIRRCAFCAIGKGIIEGGYQELEEWPNLPVICDNNLLASSRTHFDRVIDRLKQIGWADFNQGIDSRLLTDYHANRIAEIKKPKVRLSLDHIDYRNEWEESFGKLREAGISKANISSYCLVGFDSDPCECWKRCQWVENHGIKAYPMWFHGLTQLEKNITTKEQSRLGWNDEERRRIMGFYYKHRGVIPNFP